MGLKEELSGEVGRIFADNWEVRDGTVVPEAEDVALSNEAVKLDNAVILYADIADTTVLVDKETWQFAAEIYKTFLFCAAKIIRSEGGEITAYDGDRIMAVYIGKTPNTSAVRTALKINWCRINIINAKLPTRNKTFQLKHVIGIDQSSLHAARTGARGANDLVWVGRAANYAAKLATLDHSYATRITGAVFDKMADDVKSNNGTSMWEEVKWTTMGDMKIFRSNYSWAIT